MEFHILATQMSYVCVRSMAKTFCVIAIITYNLKLLLVFLWIYVRHVVLSVPHRRTFFLSLFFFPFFFALWFRKTVFLCYATQWRYFSDGKTQFSFHIVRQFWNMDCNDGHLYIPPWSIYDQIAIAIAIPFHSMHPIGIDAESQNSFVIKSQKRSQNEYFVTKTIL